LSCATQTRELVMGHPKNEMMHRQGLENIAMGVLARAKAVKECEIHEGSGIYIDRKDPDAINMAYGIGTKMVKEGQVDGTREEFMRAIKTALEENTVDECPICAKLRDE
jgi:hypothetical protein